MKSSYDATISLKTGESKQKAVQSERLLSINDVASLTGHCPVVASKIIDESQRGFTIHSRKYVLASSFFSYLRELEVKHE